MGTSLALSPLYSPNGLNGYWNLNEGTGTVAGDASGNGNTGTLVNTSTWVTGKIGDRLYYNGTDPLQYVDVGDGSTLNFDTNQPFSIAAWINFVPAIGNNYYILAKQNNYSPWEGIQFAVDGTNDRIWTTLSDIGGGSIWTITPYNSITPSTWHLVVMTYDGSLLASGTAMYLDGVAQSFAVDSNNLTSSILTTHDMTIGADPSGNQPLNGTLDDVRVYGRVLSPAEILALYNAER